MPQSQVTPSEFSCSSGGDCIDMSCQLATTVLLLAFTCAYIRRVLSCCVIAVFLIDIMKYPSSPDPIPSHSILVYAVNFLDLGLCMPNRLHTADATQLSSSVASVVCTLHNSQLAATAVSINQSIN